MVDILKEIGEPDTATDWLIAVRENPENPELYKRLDIWLGEDPVRRQEWEDVQGLAGLFKKLPVLDQNDERDTFRIPEGNSSFSRPIWAGISAFLLIFTLYFADLDLFTSGTVYSTGNGQTLNVQLEDGSQVHLAADTKIVVKFENKRRLVQLKDGRALFHVEKNKRTPFIVSASEAEVTVLGTIFEVLSRSNLTQVAVQEGRVSVQGNVHSDTFELGALDMLSYRKEVGWNQSRTSNANIASWRKGLFIAKKDTLETLVSELSDYHQGVILFADESLKKMSVTGVYNLNKPEQALDIITKSHSVKITHFSPWVVLLTQK